MPDEVDLPVSPEPDLTDPSDPAVLWELFLAGKIDELGAQRLIEFLEKNPNELTNYRNDARMSAALSYILGDAETGIRLIDSVQARVKGGLAQDDSAKFTQRVLDAVKEQASKSARHLKIHRRSWIGWSVAALLAVGLLGFAFSTIAPSNKWPEDQLAQLTILEGGATSNGLTLTQVQPITVGQNFVLDANSRATLELKDGSVFNLTDSAKVTLADAAQGFRIKLEHGKAIIQAAPQLENKRLRVETPHADVAVIGTKYTVEAFETLSVVSVESGKVSVTSSKKKEGENAASMLTAGDAAIADQGGLTVTHKTAQSRLVEFASVKPEMGSDPITIKDLSETFRGMPLRSFSYHRPNPPSRMDCGSFEMPVKLSPTENEFEIWLRPRWVKPYVEGYRLVKVVMLANLPRTQYCLGECMMFPAGKDWVVLRGKVENASVFWHAGGPKDPLSPELIKRIVIRTEIGEMEFDFTPVLIHDSAK